MIIAPKPDYNYYYRQPAASEVRIRRRRRALTFGKKERSYKLDCICLYGQGN